MYDAARQHSSDLYPTGDFVDDYAVDPEERNDSSLFFEVVVRRGTILYLKESLRWNHLVAFVLIIDAAYFMFKRSVVPDTTLQSRCTSLSRSSFSIRP